MPSLPQVLARASALGHLTADVVLRTVRVERNFGPLEHHQQLGLVGGEASEQPGEGDEAGAAGVEVGRRHPPTRLVRVFRMVPIWLLIPARNSSPRWGAAVLLRIL